MSSQPLQDAPATPRSPRQPLPAPQPLAPDLELNPPRPRPNLSSMLFLTAFFFFMSGGNHAPATGGMEIGPDGEVRPRMSELEYVRGMRDEWKGWLNGTEGNYTEPAVPDMLPSSNVPPTYAHDPLQHSHRFYSNITGFYRHAAVHPLSLSEPRNDSLASFWKGAQLLPRPINETEGWNETRAEEMRGEWDWARTVRWDMNLKERNVSSSIDLSDDPRYSADENEYPEWTWVKGAFTLTSRPASASSTSLDETITYNFYGLHHIPNGTYNLFALPEGMRPDIRRLPGLWGEARWGGEVGNETREIVLRELDKEVKVQQELFVLGDMRPDDVSETTTCPLLIHLTLPPIPSSSLASEIQAYHAELSNPTGLLASMKRPPGYSQLPPGLGGVVVADGCGWALGIEGGEGLGVDDFWRREVDYSVMIALTQLLLLYLLVHQMELTRTPSTLSKISIWTIALMAIIDSYVFSLNMILGVVDVGHGGPDGRGGGLGVWVGGFAAFAGAVIFGPRYAVTLHRIQAPEGAAPAPTPAAPVTTATVASDSNNNANANDPEGATNAENVNGGRNRFAGLRSVTEGLGQMFRGRPAVNWIVMALLFFLLGPLLFTPSVFPVFLTSLYSFWVPQIWRNARRGNGRALGWGFVLGMSGGRLVLPLYAFAYPNNMFFTEPKRWVWGLIAWQVVQVGVLYAQERFGPAFFLPKSMAPPESYNYHPIIPPPDAENPSPYDGETTCSICYEEVDLYPRSGALSLSTHVHGRPNSLDKKSSFSLSPTVISSKDKISREKESEREGLLGGLGGLDRRNYAIAPCGHVFHTSCLAQWMSIKTICPLCKRSLPPM
ncbi:ligase [Cryptococcus gattii EJB2]|uniref:RING-type E3 ubiquitin transferase n=1 Tax=Cryptococcus gattii EJB2 TaxID=1296103 RepID=A0ABR5BV14_9TREE|nr:ligase [Cryptococcus gattii EJB2]